MVDRRPDVLLVTATRIETRAILDAFDVEGQPVATVIDEQTYIDIGDIDGAVIWLMQTEMGSTGLGASQQAVSRALLKMSPSALIAVGIAFGVDSARQQVGEVLVAKRVRPYELQRIGTDSRTGELRAVWRGDKPHVSTWLLGYFRGAELTWADAPVRFGTILSGEKLVDNAEFLDDLIQAEPEAIGGEMEAAGIYVACQQSKVDWIVVKAVCDFADGHKSNDKSRRQSIAARNAAAFVRHALASVSVDWDARRNDISTRSRLSTTAQVHAKHQQRNIIANFVTQTLVILEGDSTKGLTLRQLNTLLLYSFLRAERSVGLSSFVLLRTLVSTSPPTQGTPIECLVGVQCHVTAFVDEFAELIRAVGSQRFLERTADIPADYIVQSTTQFGRYVPCVIERIGHRLVQIRQVEDLAVAWPFSTSELLIYLSSMMRGRIVVLDTTMADSPDSRWGTFREWVERAKRNGSRLEDFRVSVSNPEEWDLQCLS